MYFDVVQFDSSESFLELTENNDVFCSKVEL